MVGEIYVLFVWSVYCVSCLCGLGVIRLVCLGCLSFLPTSNIASVLCTCISMYFSFRLCALKCPAVGQQQLQETHVLVKDLIRSCWMMSVAEEMKLFCSSVIMPVLETITVDILKTPA